jgi:hypothetical protein
MHNDIDLLALTGDDQLSADPLALILWLDLLAMRLTMTGGWL